MGRKHGRLRKAAGAAGTAQMDGPLSPSRDSPSPESRDVGSDSGRRSSVSSNGEDNGRTNGDISGLDDSFVKTQGTKKRIFIARDSILTVLSNTDKNMEALYHVFVVMVITAILYSLLQDTIDHWDTAWFWVDFHYYFSGFGPAEKQFLTFLIWIPLQLAAFSVYPVFKLWQFLHPRLGLPIDVLSIVAVLLYNAGAHIAVVSSIVYFDLPPVPALVLSIEQLRLSMKSYSFIRENAYKVLYPWHKDDEEGPAVWYAGQLEPQVGSFSKYLYFQYIPTILYRDNYPRIPRVRKRRVLAHLMKTVLSVTFMSILVKEIFGNIPGNSMSSQEQPMSPLPGKLVAHTFLMCMLWGIVCMFITGYFFLHSWSNLFGEVFRFADREFYSDWWTCTTFSSFYRKWNLIVHDWIKAYIHEDLKTLFNSRTYAKVASLPTILISALFHEYVLWAPTRFVLPVLLTLFGSFGAILYFFKPSQGRGWNYMIHISTHFGVAIMVFCYSMEFYARRVCQREENFVNTFIPRSIECFMT